MFECLEESAEIETPDELQVARVGSALGSVGLIRPFNWVSLQVGFPSADEIQALSLVDCVRQVTRIVRANRTNGGVLWAALKSGVLAEICRTAHRHTNGHAVGPLDDLQPDA